MNINTNIKNRRKVYLIYPSFQLKIIFLFLILAIFTIIVYYGSVSYVMYKFTIEGQRVGLSQENIYFQFIGQQKSFINIVFLSVSISFLGLVTALGIYLSHKIAGPIYRLSEDLKSFSKGQPMRKVIFRKGDFFPELADDFNHFIEKINKK